MLPLLLSLACTAPDDTVREAGAPGDSAAIDSDPGDSDPGDSDPGDSDPEDTAGTDTGGPCPPEMALAGAVCIDRWEASLVDHSPYEVPTAGVATAAAGAVPQGYISADVAEAACQAAGKRLCTSDEWLRACRGPDDWLYPYGDTYDATACNTTYAGDHPVCDYFGTCDGVWDEEHLNDPGINQQPGTEDPAGANPRCVTPEGVYDLHGNLHEWVADADGTFRGGFYADASINGPGCTYTTTAHDRAWHDYSTGFRCCAEPRE